MKNHRHYQAKDSIFAHPTLAEALNNLFTAMESWCFAAEIEP
jgi:hypothetical protein